MGEQAACRGSPLSSWLHGESKGHPGWLQNGPGSDPFQGAAWTRHRSEGREGCHLAVGGEGVWQPRWGVCGGRAELETQAVTVFGERERGSRCSSRVLRCLCLEASDGMAPPHPTVRPNPCSCSVPPPPASGAFSAGPTHHTLTAAGAQGTGPPLAGPTLL